ncbi:MAG: hypothetical protein ACLP50_27590, partial [Solirubrobacteraceae bacterium]
MAALDAWKPGHQTRQITVGAAAVLMMAVGMAAPRGALIAVFLSLALVPYYALPSVAFLPGEVTALLALVFAVAFGLMPRRVRSNMVLTPIDFVAIMLAVVMVGSVLGHHRTFTEWAENMVLWLGPYFFGRLVSASPSARTTI